MIDINALPFEAFEKYPSRNAGYDVLQKEFNKRYDWRAKNFDYARQHGEGQGKQDIFYGKDGRTILIDYDDTEREFYPDSHWDIYQLQDDGTVAIKAILLSEYDLGRGDSISYIQAITDETRIDEAALQIVAEMKRAEIAAAFRKAKKEVVTKAEGTFAPGSVSQAIDTNATDDLSLPTRLPQELFGGFKSDPKGQKAHFKAFSEWLGNEEEIEYYRENLYPIAGSKHGGGDHLYRSKNGDLLIVQCYGEIGDDDHTQIYAIYENGPDDASIRTTLLLTSDSPGTYYDQYIVGITHSLVTNPVEIDRITREKALANEFGFFSSNKELTEKQFEQETAGVLYTTASFKPRAP